MAAAMFTGCGSNTTADVETVTEAVVKEEVTTKAVAEEVTTQAATEAATEAPAVVAASTPGLISNATSDADLAAYNIIMD